MTPPRKAIVLAAGFGTRLHPLTRRIPKALLPFRGVPLLDRTLDLLGRWGVREVLVNCHYLAPSIVAHLRARRRSGMRLSISFEPAILGTGGAVRRAAWFLNDNPAWIINADMLADVTPAPFLRLFAREQPLAVLWMHAQRGPRTVRLDGHRIADFRAPWPGAPGTATFCGLHLVSPALLRYIRPGFDSIVDAYIRAGDDGRAVLGLSVPGSYWADLGTPRAYLDAHRDAPPGVGAAASEGWSDRASPDAPFAWMGPGSRRGAHSRIRGSVIFDRAVIAPGADVNEALIGPDTRVEGPVQGLTARAADFGDPALLRALGAIGWPADQVFLSRLGARGSARTFLRAGYGQRRAIVIRYTLERPENARSASHLRLLCAAGLPVPRVLYGSARDRLDICEDLGDRGLDGVVPDLDDRARLALYRKIMPLVVRLHERGTRLVQPHRAQLCPPFSRELLQWEHDLFREHALRGALAVDPPTARALAAEFEQLADRVAGLPHVLIHRDLQSSNILLKDDRPCLIDVQGMRYGPAMYDLASLLCDPYVSLALPLQEALLSDYARLRGLPPESARAAFWLCAVQRLLQALGAFARLRRLPMMERFAAFVPPGLRMLRRALDHTEGLDELRRNVSVWLHEIDPTHDQAGESARLPGSRRVRPA